MRQRPFFRRPVAQLLAALLLLAALYWLTARAQPAASAGTVLFDLALGVAVFLLGLALISQFVLPVHSLRERWTAFMRTGEYLSGVGGPVISVVDGQPIEGPGEDDRQGAGVLVADYASAAVLRTATRFTRAVGPGITFLNHGETLAQALDLRIQRRTLDGRRPDSADDSSPNPTLALTEDGIPVSTDISVTFLLDPGHDVAPRSGQFPNAPPYEFNPRAAERAVFGKAQRQGSPVDWAELPLLVAVDQYRDEMERWRLDALLHTPANQPPPLRVLSERLKSKLARGGDDPPAPAVEILTQRGIRVLDIQVSNLRLPADVQREHWLKWREGWIGDLEQALETARSRKNKHYAQGAAEGVRYLLQQVSTALERDLADGPTPDARQTLLRIAHGALELLQDPVLEPEAADLRTALHGLIDDLDGLADNEPNPE